MHVRLLLFLTLVSSVVLIPPKQIASLVSLYTSTGGPSWSTSTNWNNSMDPCNPGWHGLDCDSLGNLIGIYLKDNKLTGSLPDLQLPELKVL